MVRAGLAEGARPFTAWYCQSDCTMPKVRAPLLTSLRFWIDPSEVSARQRTLVSQRRSSTSSQMAPPAR